MPEARRNLPGRKLRIAIAGESAHPSGMDAPPPIPPPASQPVPPRLPPRTSGSATASLALGILSLLGISILIVPPILAVVFGHVSLSKCKQDPGLRGRGVALAGLITGYVSLAIFPLLAAMAIPAFVRVRMASQDMAVLNNARQLAAAADQYYLEANVTSASHRQLVGPTNYVRALNTVAGERYPAHYTQGVTITITGVAGARTITYAP